MEELETSVFISYPTLPTLGEIWQKHGHLQPSKYPRCMGRNWGVVWRQKYISFPIYRALFPSGSFRDKNSSTSKSNLWANTAATTRVFQCYFNILSLCCTTKYDNNTENSPSCVGWITSAAEDVHVNSRILLTDIRRNPEVTCQISISVASWDT